jgi:hypothetical protein
MLWYQGVGITALAAASPLFGTSLCVFTMDGTGRTVGGQAYNVNLAFGWWEARKKLLYLGTDGRESAIFHHGLASQLTQETPLGYTPNWCYVKHDDKVLTFNLYRVRSLSPGSSVVEGPTFPFPVGRAQAGRHKHEIFVGQRTNGDADTECAFYDTLSQSLSSPVYHLGRTTLAVVFAVEWGVIVSLQSESGQYTFRVWSLDVVPTTISAPQLIAGSTAAGHVATYQVRVTGDQNDGCVGELVNWSLAGDGVLLHVQSTTDQNGYATTQVSYPTDASGDAVLTANIRC